MKFVIGIGNPDKEYEKTRHNVGFQVVDRLQGNPNPASRTAQWTKDKDLKALIAKLNDNTLLLKSTLFVNNTGGNVSALRAHHPEMEPRDCLFICDDVNLQFGKLRLRPSGSAGGHHGLESVIEKLGSEEFPRLRIGVGCDPMPQDLTSFVLQPFTAEEKKDLNKILDNAASVCEAWEKEGFESARDRLSQLQSNMEREK